MPTSAARRCTRTSRPNASGPSTTPPTPVPDDHAELTELWKELKAGSPEARERLILNFAPLVKFVAGRVGSGLPASVDQGDLIAYGIIGLIEAIARFDPEREIKFETFAIPRIRGAMLDELRALDWVPRSVRAKGRELDRAMGKIGRAHV